MTRRDKSTKPRGKTADRARQDAAKVVKRLVGGPIVSMPWKDGWYVGENDAIDGVVAVYNEGGFTLSIDFGDAGEVVAGDLPTSWTPEGFISVVQEEVKLARKVFEYSSVNDMKRIIRDGMKMFKRHSKTAASIADRVKDAYMDRRAAVATVRDRCKVTLVIDKIVPYGKPQEAGHGDVDHHFQLFGSVEHEPSFGFPIKFKVHVLVTVGQDGETELLGIHTERSGKVVPKILSGYVEKLIQQYRGSWIGSLPI